MLTSKSPRKVMLVAHHLASQILPQYSRKFSRHDFTLPQLFACLVVKELLRCTYRQAGALVRAPESWSPAIGINKPPDHNTLWRAPRFLLTGCKVGIFLDARAGGAAGKRVRGLTPNPRGGDSPCFETRHV